MTWLRCFLFALQIPVSTNLGHRHTVLPKVGLIINNKYFKYFVFISKVCYVVDEISTVKMGSAAQ